MKSVSMQDENRQVYISVAELMLYQILTIVLIVHYYISWAFVNTNNTS